MLRAATPLSIIFFVAFILLLLTTLSTPVIKAIPLGTFQGWNFGVFGYCKTTGTSCSGARVGYSTVGLFSANQNADFSLPESTRHSLSAILVVHPIAAILTLVCFGLSVAAHFHSPAHSPRYLLGLLILTVPTLLVTLLAFLVDILLFVPHVAWGGWIVLVATILIIASSVVTCAMRRTLVSRKARKQRIAETADMNGENYYENLNQTRMMADELPRADSPPPMTGSTAVDGNKLPQFATFESNSNERRSLDDRTPLNPRNPSIRSASTGGAGRMPMNGMAPEDAPPMPMVGRAGFGNGSGPGMGPRRPSVDQYGNPLPPRRGPGAVGMVGDAPPPGLRHENSQGSLGSNMSRGSAGPPSFYNRGRGGFGPPRGYGGPRGGGYGPPGRGGYGPPIGPGYGGYRGGPGGMRGRGGPGPGMMAGAAAGGMAAGAMMGREHQRGPRGPPGYDNGNGYYNGNRGASPGPAPPMGYSNGRKPSPGGDLPIGQAIEMDERSGSPPNNDVINEYQSLPYGLRDSDGDVAGMVGLQQDRRGSPMRQSSGTTDGRGAISPTTPYSENNYVPLRAQWALPQPLQHHAAQMSPLTTDTSSSGHQLSLPIPSSNAHPLSPIQASPASSRGPHAPHPPTRPRATSESYYEDVDSRFATNDPGPNRDSGDISPIVNNHDEDRHTALPSSLMPGHMQQQQAYRMPSPNHLHPNTANPHQNALGMTDNSNSTSPIERDSSTENLPEGTRSPAGSDASHFTSVSQRGINPNWRPPPGAGYGGGPVAGGAMSSASALQRRREDVLLNTNPDFSIPGMAPSMRGRGRGRAAYGGMGLRGGTVVGGLTPSGRYPTDI